MDEPESIFENLEPDNAPKEKAPPRSRAQRSRKDRDIGTSIATPLIRTSEGDISSYAAELASHRASALSSRR